MLQPVLCCISVVLCPAPAGSVSHQCRLVSFRVAVRPGPASVQCLFVRISSKQCLWCPLMRPGPRRHMQGELASASCNITPQALNLLKRTAECTMYAEQCMNLLLRMNLVHVCKPAWWGTSSRIDNTIEAITLTDANMVVCRKCPALQRTRAEISQALAQP